MKKALILFVCLCISSFFASAQNFGLQSYDTNSSYAGYTLFPMGFEAHLIDNCGYKVHSWNTDNTSSLGCYLLPNGNLLWPSRLPSNTTFVGGGGGGGRIDIYNSNSQLGWRYDYYVPNGYAAHHDVEPLPSGNFLVIAWEEIPANQLIALGKDPSTNTVNFWSERIVEMQPVGINQVNILWEWHMVDHLIQDFDPALPNYGNPANFPNRMNINVNPSATDWLHMNGIEYIEEYNQILFSCRHINEIMVIDHSTSTLEAATGSGGQQGMGGDILWRYGNPVNYDRGTASDKVLYGQHDARWIPPNSTSPHAGKITVFNNGGGQNLGLGNISTADVIDAPVNSAGAWTQPTGMNPFNPVYPDFIFYTGPGPTGTFTSSNQGGVEPLPNGNLLVCNANQAELIELDINDNVVWEYEVPISSSVFKVNRYDQTAPELSTFSLVPTTTIESPPASASVGCTVSYPCAIGLSISGLPSSTSSVNTIPLTGSPSGGSFSGPGMVSNIFNPSIAGSGLHDITYTFTDSNGCTDSVTESIFIFSITYNFVSYNALSISPKQSFNIEVDASEDASLNMQIINIDGKAFGFEQLDIMAGVSNYEIDIAHLPKGMYVITVFNNQIKSSHKFLKHQ